MVKHNWAIHRPTNSLSVFDHFVGLADNLFACSSSSRTSVGSIIETKILRYPRGPNCRVRFRLLGQWFWIKCYKSQCQSPSYSPVLHIMVFINTLYKSTKGTCFILFRLFYIYGKKHNYLNCFFQSISFSKKFLEFFYWFQF